VRIRGKVPQAKGSGATPRGFLGAPVEARDRFVVGDERSLRAAVAAAGNGAFVELAADIVLTEPLEVVADRLVLLGFRNRLLPTGDMTEVVRLLGAWCVVDGVEVGGDDNSVQTLTGFVVSGENNVLRDVVVRASTSYSSTATRLRIRDSHALTTSGGSWADLSLP
jgi:hypothetical protein